MGLKIAVVGATGAVGKQLLSILAERKFPVTELIPFSSPRSEGKEITYLGKTYRCQVMRKGCFDGIDMAFFDASDAVSKEWAPQAAASGTWVIDNSATFRMAPESLLIVPEVNGELLRQKIKANPQPFIITGPNCSTVQMVMALKPLRDHFGIKRVVVSTYQSVSGAGAAAMEELHAQTSGVFSKNKIPPQAFAHQIAFNCIPHIGGFKADGYTSEEQKMMQETRKLLGMPDLKITATAVRVPVFSCHSESINVECGKTLQLEKVRQVLNEQPGVILQDSPGENIYPMPSPGEQSKVEGGSGKDAVYVGRVRLDDSVENGLNFWVVSDNLRKGAALNAVQIGEILVQALF